MLRNRSIAEAAGTGHYHITCEVTSLVAFVEGKEEIGGRVARQSSLQGDDERGWMVLRRAVLELHRISFIILFDAKVRQWAPISLYPYIHIWPLLENSCYGSLTALAFIPVVIVAGWHAIRFFAFVPADSR